MTFRTAVLLLFAAVPAFAADHSHHASSSAVSAEYAALPSPGKQVPLAEGGYFVYSFDKTPKIGTVILKVEVFDARGRSMTDCEVQGEADMPAMSGAHSSGSQAFKLSRKGAYLLPVSIVMAGEWEVRITILRNGKVLARGSHRVEV